MSIDTSTRERELTDVLMASVGDAIVTTDALGRVAVLNPVAEDLTGWRNAQAAGRPIGQVFRLVDTGTRKAVPNPIPMAVNENHRVDVTSAATLIGRQGRESDVEVSATPIHGQKGDVVGAVLVFRDIGTRKVARMAAQHDFLTGLPNRVLLLDRMGQAVALARRSCKHVALLFVDLDRFKHVNDSLGHEAGDRLLKEIAARLKACVRATDTVCRQGGDEFVVLLPEAPGINEVAHIAEKLLEACRRRYTIDGQDVHVGASIGISLFPDDGIDVDALTRNADAAMYHAKAIGRNNFQFYTPDMNARARERLALENQLRRALQRNEFVLHYQPILHLATKAVVGCEALLRWQEPTRGLLRPAEFLPLMEDSSLIVPISQWALREACRQGQEWQDAGLRPVPVAVNLSGAQFKRKDFLESVMSALDISGMDPRVPGSGAHREHRDGRRLGHREPAAEPEGSGGSHFYRRLRHGVFQPQPPAALPHRHAEDRPVVHEGPGRG